MENKARAGLRLLAFLVDTLIVLTFCQLLVLIIVLAKTPQQLLNSALRVIIIILFSGLTWPFIQSVLISQLGGTPGKLLTGTEIVNPQGKRISFWRAFFRNQIGYMVSGMFLWLGFIWITVNKERQGWHDQIANTFVVVKNKIGLIIGLIALILLLILNTFLAFQNYHQAVKNLEFYRSIFTPSEEEFNQEGSFII